MKRKIIIMTLLFTLLISYSVYATPAPTAPNYFPDGKPGNTYYVLLKYQVTDYYLYQYYESDMPIKIAKTVDGDSYTLRIFTDGTTTNCQTGTWLKSDGTKSYTNIGGFSGSYGKDLGRTGLLDSYFTVVSNATINYTDGTTAYQCTMPDSESTLTMLQTFQDNFRWPMMGMGIQLEAKVPYTSNYTYDSETLVTCIGVDSTYTDYTRDGYPQMMASIEKGYLLIDFTIYPYYKPGNTTAPKTFTVTIYTPTHTFTNQTFTIPCIAGFVDSNGDGVDDRDGKSQEQINVPQIQQETQEFISDKPQRSEYADGILGSVEYGFDTLLYYIEYPFIALGNLLQKLVTIFNQAFTWMGTFTQFLQQIFSFLPVEVTSCIIVAFIGGTIALVYRMFRGA